MLTFVVAALLLVSAGADTANSAVTASMLNDLRREVAGQEATIAALLEKLQVSADTAAAIDAARVRSAAVVDDPVPAPQETVEEGRAFDRVYQTKNIVGVSLFFTFVVIVVSAVGLAFVAHARKMVANPRGAF
eukprot:TRINITY_DN3768_c0_g1_i1.p2 TRINITY_DN3768_c0_g1~~TRINITY_DN3768_c0_g1_i1.p2  ORF type:complete len:133 (-),score=28.26 TRINITY_DN3768_c0_g1_i1:302-700(-)